MLTANKKYCDLLLNAHYIEGFSEDFKTSFLQKKIIFSYVQKYFFVKSFYMFVDSKFTFQSQKLKS